MNNLKKLIFVTVFYMSLFSSIAQANVNCIGVPQVTKVGEFGSQEGKLLVQINNKNFTLGDTTSEVARSRLALATSALVANKKLVLRFWVEADCSKASENKTVPNSLQLLAK